MKATMVVDLMPRRRAPLHRGGMRPAEGRAKSKSRSHGSTRADRHRGDLLGAKGVYTERDAEVAASLRRRAR